MEWIKYLTGAVESTRQYWDIHHKFTLFHQLISLIISQRIRFDKSRKIRQNLYIHFNLPVGTSLTSIQIKQLTNFDFQKIGISNDKVNIIRNVLNFVPDNEWDKIIAYNCYTVDDLENIFTRLSNISGIGPWTISSLKIMFYSNIYSNILLTSDKWISCRIAELRPELRNLVDQTNSTINLSELSKFLWRITPKGIEKLNCGVTLSQSDFL